MNTAELSELVANLPQAGTLDLYRLAYIIRALYNELKRTMAARAKVNLGMVVEYFDLQDGALHRGRIIRATATDVTIDDTDRKIRLSGVAYAALNLEGTSFFSSQSEPVIPPQDVTAKSTAPFKVGDRVSFTDQENRFIVGTVVRVNTKSLSVKADHDPNHWRVSPSLLTHVIDT